MRKIFLILFTSIFVSACSSSQLRTNKSYTMVSPYFNNSLSIVFFKNKFSGQSTINKFSGDYSLSGNSIIIKNFLHTQEVGIFSKTLQENYIFEVLKNANSLIITDNEIILQTSDQKCLKYYTEPLLFY